jgi:hypothetical protein
MVAPSDRVVAISAAQFSAPRRAECPSLGAPMSTFRPLDLARTKSVLTEVEHAPDLGANR